MYRIGTNRHGPGRAPLPSRPTGERRSGVRRCVGRERQIGRLALLVGLVGAFALSTSVSFADHRPFGAAVAPSALDGREPAEPVERPNNQNATDRLPDLRTLPPWDLSVERHSSTDRVLRFANTVWNSGAGVMELYGASSGITQQTRVLQRVYASDGGARDHFVGTFVFHPEHDHWHVADFATYQLWALSADGEPERLLAVSEKLSYCMIDTDIVAPALPGFPSARVYIGCGRLRQGLSIGWGDTYEADLEGQTLDLGWAGDGIYSVVSISNPRGRLLESDYANNLGVTYFRLRGDAVTLIPPLAPDLHKCRQAGRC
ncbi:MAG TPA: lysyl oxidase family protein [Anaerolineales bacterium]|nr:lysyl oxidase family protein [Anaerolineales bacterium]